MEKVSSSKLNKVIRQLAEERDNLTSLIYTNKTFSAFTGEEPEDARPDVHIEDTLAEIEKLDSKVVEYKTKLFTYNLMTEIPDQNMSLAQALVWLPIANNRLSVLKNLINIREKQRQNIPHVASNGDVIVEYIYANFDTEKIKEEYIELQNKITDVQLKINELNCIDAIEI